MSTWHDPITWNTGDLVTADLLNQQIRDNLLHLKGATAYTEQTVDSVYSTTSETFVDIDPINLSLSVTTSGGLVIFGFVAAVMVNEISVQACFDVTVDGVRQGSTYGLHYTVQQTALDGMSQNPVMLTMPESFSVTLPTLAAGTHEFRLQWRRTSNRGSGITLENSASNGFPVKMWVLELGR